MTELLQPDQTPSDAVPRMRFSRASLRLTPLSLALVVTMAFAQSGQQAPQDVTRSLRGGGAAHVVRSTQAQPEESQPRGHAAQDVTRGVPAKVATDAATHAESGMDRGILFRVTAPSMAPVAGSASNRSASPAQVSYLFGTIHFGTPEEQGLDYDKLGQILSGISVFANEADVDSRWDARLDNYRWLPVRKPLAGMIGAEAMAKANHLLPDVKPKDLQRMRPWLVLALLEERGEQGGNSSADVRLQRIAGGMGKRLVHLETLEDQLRALDCVPPEEHARVLAERLRNPLYLQLDSAEAMAAYKARDLGAWLADVERMEGLGDAAKQIEQRSRLCLLEDRNARWIGAIENLYREQSTLVVVGALHLVGPNGLIARLRQDGFQVDVVPM